MWQSTLDGVGVTASDPIYKFLTTETALSAMLRSKCGILTVQILKHELASACIEELEYLNVFEDVSFVREVLLLGDENPLVKARVVVPMNTYLKFKNILDNLGTQLLGETLLYKQSYQRTTFEYAMLENKIARRSIFTLNNNKIYVAEQMVSQILYCG